MEKLSQKSALIDFLNDIGGIRAHEEEDFEVREEDRDLYEKRMDELGFDIKDVNVKAAFCRLKIVDVQKEIDKLRAAVRKEEMGESR